MYLNDDVFICSEDLLVSVLCEIVNVGDGWGFFLCHVEKMSQERLNLALALVKLSKLNFHINRTTWRQLTSVTWLLSLI